MECMRKSSILALVALAGSMCGGAWAGTVVLGSDYFHTSTASVFDFGPGIGLVNFMGNPVGPGNTDTIVQRQADATINGGAIPIQVVQLFE